MSRISPALLTAADRERLHGLRLMKSIALGALLLLAVVFLIAFAFQERLPWLAYVRAAAEGGMVGALADWFAVTALFRRPMGLPIPHTAIIPQRKDEIGRTLGDFVETNFLSAQVVRTKLAGTSISAKLAEWMREPAHAARIASEGATMATGILNALSDEEARELLTDLARDHLVAPAWGPPLGGWLERLVGTGAHHQAVDLAADNIATWLGANRAAFSGLVSGRLPSWVPSMVSGMIDETAYHEAVKFVDAVRADPSHPARSAIDGYLERLADSLQHDPAMIGRFEQAKAEVFDSPRVRELAGDAWSTAKNALVTALGDPESPLRRRAVDALTQVGARLGDDPALRQRVDGWVTDAAVHLVDRYRHDIASIITDTVERWDTAETSQKIELMVGRDLQYIRLNGTIVGSLAGLAIFTVAHLLFGR